MISSIFSRLAILTFGTLYPAYNSFKTVRAKSIDEYVKWMMYWIVFAIFSVAEPFSDVFLAWLPFYYELKILMILWLLPTMGNGGPIIYRKCLHPFLKKHEARLDHTLLQIRDKGQDMIFHYVTSAVIYIGKTVMDIVHTHVPNGIMGMMINHGQVAEQRAVQQGLANPLMTGEQVELSVPTASKVTKRNTAAETTNIGADEIDVLPSSSRSRGRRGRQSKPVVDSN